MRLLSLVLMLLALPVCAHDYKIGQISVAHPFAFETTGRSGAGYLEITNMGADDRLIGVRADFPRVMIHESLAENGVTRMEHRMAVMIPAGQMVMFAPGGLHVMFMGLSDHWEQGQKIPATLVFENAGELAVEFNVETRSDTAHTHKMGN